MAGYEREIVQALREIAQELRLMRNAIEGIDRRLATSGGLTNALTRRAHLVVNDRYVMCSACGSVCGRWDRIQKAAIFPGGEGKVCKSCGAMLSGEVVES